VSCWLSDEGRRGEPSQAGDTETQQASRGNPAQTPWRGESQGGSGTTERDAQESSDGDRTRSVRQLYISTVVVLQWWANHKSNCIPKSQIIWQNDLNLYAISQIKFKSHPQLSQVTKICDLVKSHVKSQKFKSNPNQIKGFQIKSFLLKSNHHIWFSHDLNQIVIWFCPSLSCCDSTAYNKWNRGGGR